MAQTPAATALFATGQGFQIAPRTAANEHLSRYIDLGELRGRMGWREAFVVQRLNVDRRFPILVCSFHTEALDFKGRQGHKGVALVVLGNALGVRNFSQALARLSAFSKDFAKADLQSDSRSGRIDFTRALTELEQLKSNAGLISANFDFSARFNEGTSRATSLHLFESKESFLSLARETVGSAPESLQRTAVFFESPPLYRGERETFPAHQAPLASDAELGTLDLRIRHWAKSAPKLAADDERQRAMARSIDDELKRLQAELSAARTEMDQMRREIANMRRDARGLAPGSPRPDRALTPVALSGSAAPATTMVQGDAEYDPKLRTRNGRSGSRAMAGAGGGRSGFWFSIVVFGAIALAVVAFFAFERLANPGRLEDGESPSPETVSIDPSGRGATESVAASCGDITRVPSGLTFDPALFESCVSQFEADLARFEERVAAGCGIDLDASRTALASFEDGDERVQRQSIRSFARRYAEAAADPDCRPSTLSPDPTPGPSTPNNTDDIDEPTFDLDATPEILDTSACREIFLVTTAQGLESYPFEACRPYLIAMLQNNRQWKESPCPFPFDDSIGFLEGAQRLEIGRAVDLLGEVVEAIRPESGCGYEPFPTGSRFHGEDWFVVEQ